MERASDYTYELPEELIAQVPADRRSDARLLAVGPPLTHRGVKDLAELVPDNAVLVVNDTRVMHARLFGQKPTGGRVEFLLTDPVDGDPTCWNAMAKSAKPMRLGTTVQVGDTTCTVVRERNDDGTLGLALSGDGFELMEREGVLPLPPYIERPPTAQDCDRYQTVFAKDPGAVAAPTAGLHLTKDALARLAARGVTRAPLTLHVGPGTFRPVKDGDVARHRMHSERFLVPRATAELCLSGRPVVCVGTTCVRALEAANQRGLVDTADTWQSTDLFIRPGFAFGVTTHLLTNFHLPESTLLMLVSAFAGKDRVLAAYKEAVARRYRFFSYGDAMFVERA